jgi:hypothetical protein
MSEERPHGLERRSFLKAVGLGGAAAVATPLIEREAEAKESPKQQIKSRYRETDEVKKFYALNRL